MKAYEEYEKKMLCLLQEQHNFVVAVEQRAGSIVMDEECPMVLRLAAHMVMGVVVGDTDNNKIEDLEFTVEHAKQHGEEYKWTE